MKRPPIGSCIAVALGAGLLFRGLYRPIRAVVREGRVVGCPGDSGCAHHLEIQTPSPTDVFVVGRGTVLEAAPGRVTVQARREPIVFVYEGTITPSVVAGQRVGIGQHLGFAAPGAVKFSVLGQTGGKFEPASWLALRGLRPAHTLLAGPAKWCGSGGRRIDVPEKLLSSCKLSITDPSSLMLLPVSVQTVK